MAIRIPLYIFTHNRKYVAALFGENVISKIDKWLRVDSHFRCGFSLKRTLHDNYREDYIYAAAAARAEFDAIYNEKDLRKSKEMLMEKEKAVLEFPLSQIYFPTSPEGVDYERTLLHEDSCLDYWHPLEKAAYPEYFAKREIRKQQFLELWEKMHGPPKPDDYSTH